MDNTALTEAVKSESRRLGFGLVGVCRAEQPTRYERFREWLDAGFAGQMDYLPNRAAAYEHPNHVLDGAKTIVMLGMNYKTAQPAEPTEGQGRVSIYAWGDSDYHDLIHDRLRDLHDFVLQQRPEAKVRGVVDTAPLLERDFAQLAGLGWIGKNTLLLNKDAGSLFFLAALLTDQELNYDEPFQTDHCGTCRACLDACPTDAFPQAYVLDATRCISYLTIELRDSIPVELREGIGAWVFGCDICQDVCPWNHRVPQTAEDSFEPQPSMNPIDLVDLFSLDDDAFRQRFRRTPLWRSRRRGILRNAAIALGNRPNARAIDALIAGLNDSEPIVRGSCAWALGRYENEKSREALRERWSIERDEEVRHEIEISMSRLEM